MKLRNIYMACKRSVEQIRNVRIYQNTTSTTRYWVSGWNDAQTAILNTRIFRNLESVLMN